MKIMKLSSILLLSMFFLWAFIPEASAKQHCRSRTSFGLSFNMGNPSYVVAPAPVAPAPVIAPAPVYRYPTYAASAPVYRYPAYVAPAPVYYPYYTAPVVVERPSVYVQPGFSYSYWRY